MLKQSNQKTADAPSACLADIRELCAEFRRAICALASNDLPTLLDGIAVQQKLADRLQSVAQQQPVQSVAGRGAPPEVRELMHVTRIYSGLLDRSRRSVRLRVALCRSFRQQFEGSPSAQAGQNTWSCEA